MERRLAAKCKAKTIGWEVVGAKCGHREKVNREQSEITQ